MARVTQKVINTIELDEREFETIMNSLNSVCGKKVPINQREQLAKRANVLQDDIVCGFDNLHNHAD